MTERPSNNPQMLWGLSPEQWLLLQRLAIAPLKQAGALVWIFGSRARGDHRPASDVDLLFEFPESSNKPSGLMYTIKCDLDESRFPFTVDLVEAQHLAESYRERVFAERKSI